VVSIPSSKKVNKINSKQKQLSNFNTCKIVKAAVNNQVIEACLALCNEKGVVFTTLHFLHLKWAQ